MLCINKNVGLSRHKKANSMVRSALFCLFCIRFGAHTLDSMHTHSILTHRYQLSSENEKNTHTHTQHQTQNEHEHRMLLYFYATSSGEFDAFFEAVTHNTL
jgi:hypothetical protein